ncbi:MAG TPA: hypothetical protein VFQ91_13035 [Bryobacteraceae bacterium]|nr:hypothetical protein [Bryobacteraceae bacterium]
MLPFVDHCRRVEAHLTSRYGIRIITRDIPDPLLGDLDGAEIHVDHAVTPEQRLFLLAHLFGHTAQWNAFPHTMAVGQLHPPPVPEPLLADILAYEAEAARIALGMLHEIGITDGDQWLSDYTAADVAYLSHFYRTGEKREFESFLTTGAPLLRPGPVPAFSAKRRALRADGIVI